VSPQAFSEGKGSDDARTGSSEPTVDEQQPLELDLILSALATDLAEDRPQAVGAKQVVVREIERPRLRLDVVEDLDACARARVRHTGCQ
jgi:hypothetical protein